jgi:hypothetical protein
MDIPLNSSYFLTHACMIARAILSGKGGLTKQIGTNRDIHHPSIPNYDLNKTSISIEIE